MATNLQLSTTESKKKQTMQTTRTGTESYIWRSFWKIASRERDGGRWG